MIINRFFQNLFLLFFFSGQLLVAQDYQYLKTDKGTTAYRIFGEGFPVLIINGGPGIGSDGFASLAKSLSENNTAIIYDQRGTGKSEIHEISASTLKINLMVEDIEKLRNHLGYDEWIVLGHSFGGMLAYAYAAKYPNRITAMIQSHSGGLNLEIREGYDIVSRLSESERDSLTYYSLKIRSGDDSSETALKRARIVAAVFLYDKNFAPQIADRLSQTNMRINSLLWSDLERIRFNTSEEMKHFEKPVLILTGKDEIAPVRLAEKAHDILPNSELVVMEKCGHYGWLERPDIYLTKVKKFLNENSAFRNEYH